MGSGTTLEELKSYVPGQILDVELISRDHPLGARALHPGAIFRMRFESIRPELEMTARPSTPKPRMQSPVVYMIWGTAIVEETPEHYFHPPEPVPENLRYGLHDWLVESIKVVG